MWRARRPRLLDPARLARYRGLALRVRGGATERPGEQRVPGRTDAGGLEVEAWRPYVSGDDLRHLDWGALGRLDALLVRRYTAERQAGFHLLLDASASMGLPDGGVKLAAAREAALALAYIALAGGDAVRTAVLAADGRTAASAWHRHRGAVTRVADALAADVRGGALDLGAALGAYAERHAGPGVAVVLSDLMAEPEGVERGVVALRARRFAVVLVHVVAPSELDPRRRLPHGILRDAESGEEHAIGLTSAAVAEYRRLVDAHLAALRALARRTRSHYARLVAGQAVRDLVTGELARLGLVRRR
jgi:uncharacterized protein (DUF58 family)